MIKLRDYQSDMIQRVRDSIMKHRRVILQSATGSGKTVMACHMMQEAAAKGKRVFFLVHQNELLQQTSRSLWRYQIEHGLIVSGKGRSNCAVQVASVMTLKNRLADYEAPDLIIIDESHRAFAASYKAIVDAYPNAAVVGLTASPQRTDSKGLGELFYDIVNGPSIRYLIDMGALCDYELFGVPQMADLSSVRTRAGDYAKDDLEREVNKPKISGDAVQHYKRLASGKKCVVLCVSIKHAEDVAQAYRDAGISASAIHGKSKNRLSILADFESGKTLVLTSVNLLIEGYDHSEIAVVQQLRPTQSIVVYLQAIGRGLRPDPSKKHLIILDHVGNYQRHSLPCDERTWSLEGKKKGSRGNDEPTLSVQTCEQCYFTFKSGVTECPHCGDPVEFKARVIEQVDGELQRIEIAAKAEQERVAKKREQGKARTLDELVRLGVDRDIKNPSAWAANLFAARQGRRAAANDYTNASRILRGLA